jgi:hypothetical protein
MFDLIVPASELQNLPDFKLYIRTLLNGKPQDPILVQSFPPFPNSGHETTADLVIRASGARFGRDRQAVERILNRFLLPSTPTLRRWRGRAA